MNTRFVVTIPSLKLRPLLVAATLGAAAMLVSPALHAQEAAPAAEDAAPDTTSDTTSGEAGLPAPGELPAGEEGMSAEEGMASAEEEALAEGPMADVAGEEEPENPYGLSALWNQGDFVSKFTLIVLALMSMGSWYILITKLFEQRRLFDQFNRVIKLFAPTATLKEGIAALPERNSFRAIAMEGEEAVEQFDKGLSGEVTLADWSAAALNRGVDTLNQKLQGGLAFLATVGSTAPFIGLFGTVWGIYHALVAIGMSGQAPIDKVAGPVGEALIMTAIGLAVAVPAVLGYNLLMRRNKGVASRAKRFATEVHLRILTGRRA